LYLRLFGNRLTFHIIDACLLIGRLICFANNDTMILLLKILAIHKIVVKATNPVGISDSKE